MTTAPNRAVLYLRSSKDRSDISIDAQRRALQEMAAARDFLIVGEYADAVESGKDDDRPGFQSLLRDMRASGRTWNHVLALDTARVARRRVLAIIFEEQECKRNGVRVVYKSLPESDPITEMLLKSILQAMDEWHSLTSKVKGLAGMAENVRQGWRAGGRAPRGYRLAYSETGAVRDGSAVTKSKLVVADDALQVRAYLQARARGSKRPAALTAAGVDWPITSLIEIERNALTYAGHTVWNRAAERTESGYANGGKWRQRSEWVVQRDTHEALISEADAEILLATLQSKKRSGGAPARRVYLLAGLLVSPDGEAWHGDGGSYRLGKGVRISADAAEQAVIPAVLDYLRSDATAAAIARHYREAGKARRNIDTGVLRRQVADIDRKAGRLADLIADTSAPEALLRKIEELEVDRNRIAEQIAGAEADQATSDALRKVSAADIQRMLSGLAESLSDQDAETLRDALRATLDRVEMTADSFEVAIHFRLSASKRGEQVASPRSTVQFPAFRTVARLVVPHNRRRAL